MKALAAVLYERGGNFVFEEIDVADPKENEVLVKIIGVGICHTDEGGRQWLAEPPVVLGHEGSGVIEKVGSNVTKFKPGDNVIITVSTCGTCDACKKQLTFVCENLGQLNFGGKMIDGTSRLSVNGKTLNNFFGQSSFATYSVVNENSLIKVDSDVDISILGPLGCGIQTGFGTVLGCLNATENDSIVIFGCGSLGLSGVMGAKVANCKNIIAVGGTPEKLKLALELGATHVINRKEVEDVAVEIKKITGKGANYAFETTGAPQMFTIALKSLADLGKVAICGVGSDFTFDPMDLIVGAKSIVGSNEGNVDFHEFIPRMIQYYKNGQLPLEKIVTFYKFEEIEQAFKDSLSGNVVKPILKME